MKKDTSKNACVGYLSICHHFQNKNFETNKNWENELSAGLQMLLWQGHEVLLLVCH